MNTNNPTALRLGMSGTLFDRTYKICGRVVLSTDVDGERYFWHEFFLKAPGGEEATLVFEETESGPTWRYFEYFEPQNPLSVVDASRITEDTKVTVDAFSGTVDFIGSSTVREIEGEAPEGVSDGDYSQFFNATDKTILVVSWSNGEVEHYIGQNLTRGIVRSAFGNELPASYKQAAPSVSSSAADTNTGSRRWGGYIVAAIIAGVVLFQFLPSGERKSSRNFTTRPPPPIQLDASKPLTLQGRTQRIASTVSIEYATPSFTRQGRLYELTDETGTRSQLLQGVEDNPAKFILLDGLTSNLVTTHTPKQLGALKRAASFDFNTQRHRIVDLFRLRVLRQENGTPDEFTPGKTLYGFVTESSLGPTHFAWDEEAARASPRAILTDLPSP